MLQAPLGHEQAPGLAASAVPVAAPTPAAGAASGSRDGGHAAGALWEGLRRSVARLRRRPDPGPVDVARALPLAYGVATVLIGMSVLLIYADIVRPIQLGG